MCVMRRVSRGLFVCLGTLFLDSTALKLRSESASATPPPLDNAVMHRSLEELTLAQAANKQSKDCAGTSRAIQQSGVARRAVGHTEDDYEKVSPMVPEANAQALVVRKYAFRTSQLRDHVLEVARHFQFIARDAASTARKTVEGWIKADAEQSAEVPRKDNKIDKLASAVAAAAEPYHIALLRNQKFCAETYSKAKTAQSSSQKLIDDAKKIALKAQELQAGGLGLEAVSMKASADGMMGQAENLRQWGNKLYGQANTACGTAAGYTLEELQAATNAAMTTIINAPMKLPPKSSLRR